MPTKIQEEVLEVIPAVTTSMIIEEASDLQLISLQDNKVSKEASEEENIYFSSY